MPHPLAFAQRTIAPELRPYVDRWAPDAEARWLDRALLVSVLLALAWTAWLVLVADDARGDAGPVTYGCVVETVDRASAFAAVMGDDRPVDRQFAEHACRTAATRP